MAGAIPGALVASVVSGPAGFFTVLTAGAISGGVAGAIAGYSAKNSTAVMQSAYNSGLAAGFETGVAMIFTGAGAAVQILVGAGAAATTNVIGQLAHGVSLNQLNYASIGWSALQGGAFAAVGKAAMYAGCKLGITPFCFAPDTPISTGQGFLPISIIEQFQEVWAFDLHAERWEFKPVLETFAFDYEGDMAHVSLVGPAGEETIRATPGHPYWVIEGEGLDERPKGEHIQAIESDLEGSPVPGRWVDAGDLRRATCCYSRMRNRCAWSVCGWSRIRAKCTISSSASRTTTPSASTRRSCITRAIRRSLGRISRQPATPN